MTGGADTLVKIFEAGNLNAEPQTCDYHQAPVNTLAIHPKVPALPLLNSAATAAYRVLGSLWPQAKAICTGTEEHMVNFLTYPSCEFEKLVTRGQSAIRHVEFGPKGRFLAVATDDGVIRYINVQMPAQFTVLRGHTDSVRAIRNTLVPARAAYPPYPPAATANQSPWAQPTYSLPLLFGMHLSA